MIASALAPRENICCPAPSSSHGGSRGRLGVKKGSFALEELEAYRGTFGLGIERDLSWVEKPFSEAKRGLYGHAGSSEPLA